MGYVPLNYNERHNRVKKARGKASDYQCALCDKQANDWATITGSEGQEPDEYLHLCRTCHARYDAAGRRGLRDVVAQLSSQVVWQKHLIDWLKGRIEKLENKEFYESLGDEMANARREAREAVKQAVISGAYAADKNFNEAIDKVHGTKDRALDEYRKIRR